MELPDYWLARPGVEPDPDMRASFDRTWDRGIASGDGPMVEVEPALRWQFLCHLADARGFVLHGSGDSGIDVFEPRQAVDLSAFGNQKAVYAAGDGIWAMFFAIVDRDRVPSVTMHAHAWPTRRGVSVRRGTCFRSASQRCPTDHGDRARCTSCPVTRSRFSRRSAMASSK